MIVDFHTHTFPDRIADAAVRKLSQTSHTVPFTDGTDSGLVRSMQAAGVDRAVILSVATAPGQVISINDSAERRMERRAGLGLAAFGAMHPDFDGYRSELARIREMGMRGIKLHPVYQGADLDDRRMLRIYDRCAELGLMVIVHGGLDIGCLGVNRCSPLMALHALRELACGRTGAEAGEGSRFRFILAHMGGWRQWDLALRISRELLEAGPLMLDTAFSCGAFRPIPGETYWTEEDTKMLSRERFLELVRAFGPERILFGSDSPWSDQSESLEWIRSLPLPDGDLEQILGGNAARLLDC